MDLIELWYSLYARGVFSGFRRSRLRQSFNQSLIHIDGVNSRKAVDFYLGKTVVLVRKSQHRDNPAKFKPMYGKIIAAHGKAGVVRAKFHSNLPAEFMGHEVRVMLY